MAVSMEPTKDDVSEWSANWMEEIEHTWRRGPWSVLDSNIFGHRYDLGDMTLWPVDGAVIYTSTEGVVMLGSAKAAASLDELHITTGKRVEIVVTLCGSELESLRGRPVMGWEQYYRGFGAKHIRAPISDWRSQGDDGQIEASASEWLEAWTTLFPEIEREIILPRQRERAANKLFHCYGGIQRSSATVCAWLIYRHRLDCDAAIAQLLRVRPGLRPWRDRPHALWALRVWEHRCRRAMPGV